MSVRVTAYKRGGWEVDIRILLPDGQRLRDKHRAPCSSESGAKRWGEARERSLLVHGKQKEEVEAPKAVLTLDEFTPIFVEQYIEANRLKPSTASTYKSRIKLHLSPALGSVPLNKIDKGQEQKLKASMKDLEAKTANDVLGVLSKLLNVAVELGELATVPVKLKKLKVTETPYAFYDFDQYQQVVEAAEKSDPRYYAVILLGGDAGLRRAEIASLEWSDLDFKRSKIVVQRSLWQGHVTTPKGGRPRTVFMTKRLAAALLALRHLRGERVFYQAGEAGEMKPITESTVNEWMVPVMRRAGLKLSRRVHILRHTFCSHLAMRGAPAPVIMELVRRYHRRTVLGDVLARTPCPPDARRCCTGVTVASLRGALGLEFPGLAHTMVRTVNP